MKTAAIIAMFFAIFLSLTGCSNFIVMKPEALIRIYQREIDRSNVEGLMELYSEPVELVTAGNPLGRLVPKADIEYYYSEFFNDRELRSFEITVLEINKSQPRVVDVQADFELHFAYKGSDYSVSANVFFTLVADGRRWRISVERNGPILGIYEPASVEASF